MSRNAVICCHDFPALGGDSLTWASGGMADALDLGSSVAIRVGSSPTSPTIYVLQNVRHRTAGKHIELPAVLGKEPSYAHLEKHLEFRTRNLVCSQ